MIQVGLDYTPTLSVFGVEERDNADLKQKARTRQRC